MDSCVWRVRITATWCSELLLTRASEVEIKLVNRHDMEQIVILREHPKPIKHLTYDPSGKYLAASCTNGIIYIYDMTTSQPTLLRTVDGVIQRLETAMEATSRCVWHPDGRAFACATATREIVIVSVEDGATQRSFKGGHNADITAMAWSPNGAILASASLEDDQLVLWETKTQQIIRKYNYEKILNVTWHKDQNLFNWTNSWGECYIIPNFLKDESHIKLLNGPQVRAPFYHDPLDERAAAANGRKALVNGQGKQRAGTPDSLDELLGPAPDDEFEWIEDDDGAGYSNGNGKRTNDHLGLPNGHASKLPRQETWQPQIHEPFQPGATPWRGNRKYLCLNLIGFVWTVDQDTHNTVTVEFYDREMHRDFHFTDPFLYDKACLNENGTLFSCPSHNGQPAMVFYRPHETWTNRQDIRVALPDGEEVVSIALSNRYIVAVTSKSYARVWTLFGTPVKIWRMKSCPAVTCAAHGDYIMVVGNGAVGADGCTQLVYSIEDLRAGEGLQCEDIVALGTTSDSEEEPSLKNLFWTDNGDPCAYDSNGVLMVLMHWRSMGQAKWVPLLDTKELDRLREGKKEETYWPVAVAGEKFHCIILKGGEKSPYFPRPLLSEFELKIPVGRPIELKVDEEESNVHAGTRLEEQFVRSSVLLSLLEDLVAAAGDRAGHGEKSELVRREIEVDKTLLQLLAVECREGEERDMKALEIVNLMRDRAGKMVDAAAKVAGRWGRNVLEEKIREVGERRLMGLDEE